MNWVRSIHSCIFTNFPSQNYVFVLVLLFRFASLHYGRKGHGQRGKIIYIHKDKHSAKNRLPVLRNRFTIFIKYLQEIFGFSLLLIFSLTNPRLHHGPERIFSHSSHKSNLMLISISHVLVFTLNKNKSNCGTVFFFRCVEVQVDF